MRRAVVAGGGGLPADRACHVLQLLRQLIGEQRLIGIEQPIPIEPFGQQPQHRRCHFTLPVCGYCPMRSVGRTFQQRADECLGLRLAVCESADSSAKKCKRLRAIVSPVRPLMFQAHGGSRFYDIEERFSLAGAAHRPSREGSALGGRAGERKTCWTKPLPRIELWALNATGRPDRTGSGTPEPRNGVCGPAWGGLAGRSLARIGVSAAA